MLLNQPKLHPQRLAHHWTRLCDVEVMVLASSLMLLLLRGSGHA
jgi:hypothetical protein